MNTELETEDDKSALSGYLNLNGLRVLIVNDEADSREFFVFVLEHQPPLRQRFWKSLN